MNISSPNETDKQWGPWIQHDGSGFPALLRPKGIHCRVKLLNPTKNFAFVGIIEFVTGDEYIDHERSIYGCNDGCGDSWRLPVIDPHIYYASEYQIRKPPELDIEIEVQQSILDRNWIVVDERSDIPAGAW